MYDGEILQKWLRERSHEQLFDFILEQCQCNDELCRTILDLAKSNGRGDLIARILAQANGFLSPQRGREKSSLQSMLEWSVQLKFLVKSQQADIVCAVLEQVIPRLGGLYELSIDDDWGVVCLADELQRLHAKAWIQDAMRPPSDLTQLLDTWEQADDYGIMSNMLENYATVVA